MASPKEIFKAIKESPPIQGVKEVTDKVTSSVGTGIKKIQDALMPVSNAIEKKIAKK
jgi:hypothetical protein